MNVPDAAVTIDLADPTLLPATMVGRPFGFDEAGKSVGRTKGSLIRSTVQIMLEDVARRTKAEGASEGSAELAAARAAALNHLISRLNAAIPDPHYHITADYLMNEGHSYSVEFDTFLSHICWGLSGNPQFHFARGLRGMPSSVVTLVRPLSLSQVYRLLPRFAAKVADTDFRVISVSSTSAVIRWYSDRDLARLPESLHRIFLNHDCDYIQGALAAIPQLHSGQPPASVRELKCRLHGDPYCEWEFTWTSPLKQVAAKDAGVQGGATSKSTSRGWLFAAEIEPDPEGAHPASEPVADTELPPLPPFVERPPFGADRDGRPIREITGGGMIGALRQLHDYVGRQLSERLPADTPEEERRARVREAQLAALDELAARLNASLPDPRFHVSRDYLLDESHYYSHEFNLYVNEVARAIAGDPYFHFHRGLKSIPAAVLGMARPLTLRQIYALLPRLTSRVTEADFEVVGVGVTSATIRWLPARQLARLPSTLHQRYLAMACQAYQGVFAAFPMVHDGLPVARIRERSCALHGDPYCEWEFNWERTRTAVGVEVWIGALLAALLVIGGLLWLPGVERALIAMADRSGRSRVAA